MMDSITWYQVMAATEASFQKKFYDDIYQTGVTIDEYVSSKTVKNYKMWVDEFNTVYYYDGEVRLDSRVAATGLVATVLVFLAARMRVMAYAKSADQNAEAKKAVADAWAGSLPLVIVGALLWLAVASSSAMPMPMVLFELVWTIVWILSEVHFSMVVAAWSA
jgi:hypothetical protein